MEQIVEPMDVDSSFAAYDSPTDACQDDENETSKNQPVVSGSRNDNQGDSFLTEINILDRQEQAKMEERAKRFGLQDKLNKAKVKDSEDFYASMPIANDSDNTKHLRLNALHTRGTNDTSTNDDLTHIEDYSNTSVDWMDDVSCIKGLSSESRKRQYKQLRQPKKRAESSLDDAEDTRKRSKNPWGTLSETWGLNDSVEDTFLQTDLTTEQRSSVKERLGIKNHAREAATVAASIHQDDTNSETESESSDEEWCKRSKGLRMRMHADDEEEKMLKKRLKQRTQELLASEHSETTDLRSRLRNSKANTVYRDTIQVVVTNTADRFRPRSLTPEVQDEEVAKSVDEDDAEVAEEEVEEGEWIEANEQHDEAPVEEDEAEEEEEESDDSDLSEKEVQGPKGSVIKVVPRVKPRVASTVWARLNNTKSETESQNRFPSKGDLGGTIKGDLRSRLGHQKRGRSPLRIEVRNDKYNAQNSGTE